VQFSNSEVRKMFGINGKYAAYDDFFLPNGNFKFVSDVENAMHKSPSERNEVDREILKINERVYIAYMIYTGSYLRLFPIKISKKENYRWYSISELKHTGDIEAQKTYYNLFRDLVTAMKEYNATKVKDYALKIYNIQKLYSYEILPSKQKIKMEILYNHAKIFSSLIGVYLLFGIIVILLKFVEIFKGKAFKKLDFAFLLVGLFILLLHTANMFLRWYIAGHLPWSNAYESIIFIAWSAAFVSLVFFKRYMLAVGAGFFIAGMFMFVAHLNSIDPQITNMVPVLKSYWLLIHVAIITISYGFLAVAAMLGFLNMILFTFKRFKKLDDKIEQMNSIIYAALYMGLIFLSIGTLTGGVWANESWGRYWSWDPKETWSLIAILAYVVVLHEKIIFNISKAVNEFVFSLLAFLSFFFILMTYFGVNFYIAQGLHSYGMGQAGYEWFYVLKFGVAAWFVVMLSTLTLNVLNRNSKQPIK